MTSEDKSKELFNIFDNKFINESNRVFYFFFDKEIANSISKNGRRLIIKEEII